VVRETGREAEVERKRKAERERESQREARERASERDRVCVCVCERERERERKSEGGRNMGGKREKSVGEKVCHRARKRGGGRVRERETPE